ncbi:hypothetical protein [Haloarcula sp. 1CSR25-25]|jgi:hypothetical protein|uniref:hypothetical protein n=1 Tax=Haloarcula sp. 1CSR25-25 TaxID=2862545 RepID=UPI002893BA29|nr:hypothetical protein [Haloarcula sp. 1CSR25-25]MDT3437595.1 hypothetical protein [Haloarcula sp. 1CSR25-25]
MTTPPLLDYPQLFALGIFVVPLAISYLTVRILRWQNTLELTQNKLLVTVFLIHISVMFASGGILALINGLPETGNLIVIFAILGAIYIPVLAFGASLLYWYLKQQTHSSLPFREFSVTFTLLNLAIYPLLGLLFMALS